MLAAALGGASVLLAPAGALAHSNVDMGDFYAGLSQPVFHWELLLLALAAALWSSQAAEPDDALIPAAFLLSALTAATAALWIAPAAGSGGPWIVRVESLCLGLLVAARLRLARVGVAVGALAGLSYGWVAAVGELAEIGRPLPYVLGLASGALVLFGWVLAFTTKFRAFWAEVAVRVVGSWIATISLLVAALELAPPRQ